MKDWSGTRVQQEALTVPCTYCKAAVGSGCVRFDGKPLEGFPAHTSRSSDARAKAQKETA